MSTEEHVVELLSGYALGCLDSDEKQQVERHLPGCASCQAELASYRQVVDVLPMGMALREPPPELKENLMAEARRRRSLPRSQAEPGLWARFLRWLSGDTPGQRRIPLLSAASLVIIVLLIGSNFFLWQQVRSLQGKLPPAFSTVSLKGTVASPDASGLLVISANGAEGSLVVDNLAKLDADHEYQLWLNKDGQRSSGGTFSTNKTGYGLLWVKSEQPLDSYNTFGVTIEPTGGSPGPTGDKVLGGTLSK